MSNDIQKNSSFTQLLLILIVLFLLLGGLPLWPYSLNWGYLPSGGMGLVLLILVILLILKVV
jgi:hypothetical protein